MGDTADPDVSLERERLLLERDRLQFERQKLTLELELAKGGKSWKELLASPFLVAIVSGLIAVISTLITTAKTADENRRSEDLRAKYASDSAKQALQAELIKKFVDAPKTETVRGNL